MTRKIYILLAIILVCPHLNVVFGQSLPTDGQLTVRPDLQELGQKLMEGKQGSIIALNPANGEIYCMVSTSEYIDTLNRAIATEYSPGSTFKTVQMLTLLSENILVPSNKYSCNKGFWCANIHIGCHPHYSPLSMIGALGHSCNSYFCKGFMAMINNRTRYKGKSQAINVWHDYMTSMGLGHPLGIDIPGEKSGLIPDAAYLNITHKNRWNAQTIMWLGMGQGEVLVTPIQLCNLAAVIANRGYYYIPHIYESTKEHPLDKKYTERKFAMGTKEAYENVVAGMRAAVVNGTCASINTKGYKTCGKTGTAENEGDDHSVFMGFAPMTNPQICVSVYIENGGFGADLAAPIAALIIEKYLKDHLSEKSELKVDKFQQLYFPAISSVPDKTQSKKASVQDKYRVDKKPTL